MSEDDGELARALAAPFLGRGPFTATEIGDGATLQAGIGEVPDATIAGVLARRGLRVWTEMFSDGVLVLERAGALDPSTPVRTSFVFGSQELYD